MPDAQIFAASMLWEQEIPVASPSSRPDAERYDIENVLEIGTQLSVLPGFNIQWIMTSLIILERMVYDPDGVVFAATYGDSVASAHNMTSNMHFVEWVDVPPALKCLRLHHLKADGDERRGIKWFRPTLATINAAAELIVDLSENPRRTRVSRRGSGNGSSSGFFFDASNIEAIEINLDAAAFQLPRADYNSLLLYARRIATGKPTSLDELKKVVENYTISSSFIKCDI